MTLAEAVGKTDGGYCSWTVEEAEVVVMEQSNGKGVGYKGGVDDGNETVEVRAVEAIATI